MTPITPKPIQDFIPATKPAAKTDFKAETKSDILPGERRRPQLIDSFRPSATAPKPKPQVPDKVLAQPHRAPVTHAPKTTNIDGVVRQQTHSQSRPVIAPAPHPVPPVKTIGTIETIGETSATSLLTPNKPIIDIQRPKAPIQRQAKSHNQPYAHLAPHPALYPQHLKAIQPVKAVQPAVATPKTSRPWAKPAAQSTIKDVAKDVAKAVKKPAAKFENDEYLVDKIQNKLHRMGKAAVIGLVLAVLLTMLSLYSLQLGEILIAVYAVVVIFKRLASRYTFMLALAMFGGIIVTQLVSPDSGISENIAVYAFLLLCVGTLSLAREVRRDDSHTAV